MSGMMASLLLRLAMVTLCSSSGTPSFFMMLETRCVCHPLMVVGSVICYPGLSSWLRSFRVDVVNKVDKERKGKEPKVL